MTGHRNARRFFWALLAGASIVSLLGNVVHAVLPLVPRVWVQVGAAAVPPIALVCAVHGIALAVRAGASGRVYRVAVGAVALIGAGAFAVSFLALRGLMESIGYGATAWVFPAIIDTAVAVSTVMLVALGERPKMKWAPSDDEMRATLSDHTPPAADGAVTSGDEPAVTADSVDDEQRTLLELAELVPPGITTQSPEMTGKIMAAHLQGVPVGRIALETGAHHSTVRKIVNASKRYRE